jgi:hypothetical protein
MKKTDQKKRKKCGQFPENKKLYEVGRKHHAQHGPAEKEKIKIESTGRTVPFHVRMGI